MIKLLRSLSWGLLSFMIYGVLIVSILYYFNTKTNIQPKHFVKKDDDRIKISVKPSSVKVEKITPIQKIRKKEILLKPKPKPIPKPIQKPKPKPKVKSTIKAKKVVKKVEKKIIKKSVTKINPKVTKKIPEKKVVKKTIKTSDLFSNVSTKEKQITTKTIKPKSIKQNIILKSKPVQKATKQKSASNLINETLNVSTQHKDKGIEESYLANIEKKLSNWPAQSEYLGMKAKVWFKVQPSGEFIYKVTSGSENKNFNLGLISYIEQLKIFGFGSHKGNRAYEVNVEFIATD